MSRGVADPELSQRKHDHGGVVDVRIEIVVELERPAARREVRTADRPVTGDGDFLPQQPVAGSPQARVVGRHAGRTECQHRERGVPDR